MTVCWGRSPWWWRQYVPPKRSYLPTSLHGVTTQKTLGSVSSETLLGGGGGSIDFPWGHSISSIYMQLHTSSFHNIRILYNEYHFQQFNLSNLSRWLCFSHPFKHNWCVYNAQVWTICLFNQYTLYQCFSALVKPLHTNTWKIYTVTVGWNTIFCAPSWLIFLEYLKCRVKNNSV
jgi:hypothetical protein